MTTLHMYTVIMSCEPYERIDTSDISELDEAFFQEAEVRLPSDRRDERRGRPHPSDYHGKNQE